MLSGRRCIHIGIMTISLAILAAVLFWPGKNLAAGDSLTAKTYEDLLFDDSRVHAIDIRLDDWNTFLANAPEEKYVPCTLVIDGETYEQIGLRAKGNNSRKLVEKYGWNRYSLKIEFDHYVDGRSYHGLDKLSLDASFQDNSYLKNYLAYDMMRHMGVPSPLCSYVWVTVNGEPWGLFLAIEEPEEAFARRSFGANHGQLYKPDYKNLEHENADIALRYTDDEFSSYDNIFRKAKFMVSDREKQELIHALKCLSEGSNLEEVIDVDEVLRYFTVQVFVVNMDSYLGRTGHNYFLYQENGKLQILPWDYNLAFATYSLGMPDPINDSELYINYPIDTPAAKEIMLNRPLYHNLMLQEQYYQQYHQEFDYLLSTYFESNIFEERVRKVTEMIDPYVKQDPTAFCSHEDFELAVETITQFCLLRAKSVRGQLSGEIPSTIRGQSEDKTGFIDASSVWLPDMGEVADLKARQK